MQEAVVPLAPVVPEVAVVPLAPVVPLAAAVPVVPLAPVVAVVAVVLPVTPLVLVVEGPLVGGASLHTHSPKVPSDIHVACPVHASVTQATLVPGVHGLAVVSSLEQAPMRATAMPANPTTKVVRSFMGGSMPKALGAHR